MPWTTGNASSNADLLNKLKTYVTVTVPSGDQWVSERHVSGDELILRGQGYSTTDQIYVGLKAYNDSINDNYALYLNGFTGFNTLLPFFQQPGCLTLVDHIPALASVFSVPTNPTAIKYWFIVDASRIIIISRTGTVYHQAYLGFYLPFGTPPTYPYPQIVGGSTVCDSIGRPAKQSDVSTATHAYWKSADAYNTSPITQHVGSLALREPGGSFKRIVNTNNTALSNYSACTGTFPFVENNRGYLGGYTNMRTNLDGSYSLQPILIIDGIPANVFGFFTGVYHVTGFGLSAEDVIDVSGDDFLCIHNVFATADDNMVAYKLI